MMALCACLQLSHSPPASPASSHQQQRQELLQALHLGLCKVLIFGFFLPFKLSIFHSFMLLMLFIFVLMLFQFLFTDKVCLLLCSANTTTSFGCWKFGIHPQEEQHQGIQTRCLLHHSSKKERNLS